LPFYLVILWWLLGSYGIVGAAIAWVVRVSADTLFLFAMSHRILPAISPFKVRPLLVAGVAISVIVLGSMTPTLALKGWYLLLVLVAFIFVTWQLLLTAVERNVVLMRLKSMAAIISG
jgi:hypothetical protein